MRRLLDVRLTYGGNYPQSRISHSYVAVLHQFAPPCHVDIEIGDLLSEGIPVNAQKIGAFRLIAARRIEGDLDQGQLDLAQDALVQTGWRELPAVQVKIALQMIADRS